MIHLHILTYVSSLFLGSRHPTFLLQYTIKPWRKWAEICQQLNVSFCKGSTFIVLWEHSSPFLEELTLKYSVLNAAVYQCLICSEISIFASLGWLKLFLLDTSIKSYRSLQLCKGRTVILYILWARDISHLCLAQCFLGGGSKKNETLKNG